MATSNNESNHTMRLLASLVCLTTVLCVLASCSKPPLPGPQPYPVHGTVSYRGQPAKGFRVAFHPLKAWVGAQFAPSAVTDDNGQFRLQSYHTDDGAPVGEYAVTFTWPQHVNTGDESDPMPEVDQLRGLYNDPRKSRFKVTVRAEGKNTLEPFVLP